MPDPFPTPSGQGAAASAADTPGGLRRAAMRGTAIMASQTVITRLVAVGAQIGLAWLLSEEAFGLISIVLTVSVFAEVLKDGGIRDVLIQCGPRWDDLVSPAFWLATTTGLISAGVIVAVSVPAAHLFDSPLLVPLLLIMALEPIINTLTVIPSAKLQRDMRFSDLAIGEVLIRSGTLIGAVVCALLGAGVFSFVIPRPIFALIRCGWVWWRARPMVSLRPTTRAWGEILKDSWYLIGVTGLHRLYAYADYAVLAFFATKTELGLYYFAFSLSIQSVELLSTNLGAVLFPAFASIRDDPERRRAAFVKVSEVVIAVGVPMLALQAACADAGIRMLFEPRWYGAIPMIECLSVGLGFRVATGLAHGLLKSAGRFQTLFILMLLMSLLAIALDTVAAAGGYGAVGVAVSMSAWSVLFGLINLVVGYRLCREPVRSVGRAYLGPVAVSVLAVLPWVLLDRLGLVSAGVPAVVRLMVVAVGGGVSIALVTRWIHPQVWRQLEQIIGFEQIVRKLVLSFRREA